jgi:uncharacterized protein (TIGR03118 family)
MTRNNTGPATRAIVSLLAAALTALVAASCGGGYGGGGGGGNRLAVTITASPTTITLGQGATLDWTSSSGTSCMASGGWNGAKAVTGNETVTPAATGSVMYTLTCSGGMYTGSQSASATVTVDAATAFSKTVLVADTGGVGAETTDSKLVNPWGIALGQTTPAWVANNHSDTSTVYDGNGKQQPAMAPLVANLPEPSSGVQFEPTGMVFNGTSDFVVFKGNTSGPARFIFAGEAGAIAGWTSSVDVSNAIVVYVDTGAASYTGLTLANSGTANFLYAADFANGKVDVFDKDYVKQDPASFAFADPNLPAGYAPFGIQALPTGSGGAMEIYVAYARKNGNDEEVGDGLGIVDKFDANGVFTGRLVDTGGKLNAPWGMALAPDDAGSVRGALLVGNFGDGKINGFDVSSGANVGTLKDSSGQDFAVPGLWGIAFGNDHANQPHNTLLYAAGTNGEVNGEFGRLDLGDTPPVLNQPPDVSLTAPAAGNVSGTVSLTATATSPANVNLAKAEFFAGTTSLGTAMTSPYSVDWDTTQMVDGVVALTAKATDVDGNVGTSAAVTVTIANNSTSAATLTQLQTQIFTPKCASCHNGSSPPGGALPGSQDLRAGHTFTSLVNVASLESPTLMRVKPGDSANSYVIHKLEGGPNIQGVRMPQFGPFLDQATIDMVKAWIDAGAQDN